MVKYLTTILIFCTCSLSAQKRGNIWCFGHYAAVNFNGSAPVPDTSAVISRGSCASICDTSGNLQFYVSGDTVALYVATIRGGKVYNKTHHLMQGGDSLITRAWYQEEIIIPFPDDSNKYYVFTAGVTSIYGLYYSVIDLSLNSGLGAVIQKNTQVMPNPANDGLTAVKHGNGRDWWLIHREANGINNTFNKILISPTGISGPFIQNIGTNTTSNLCKYVFNKTGNKLAMVSYDCLVEMFDFDRCTGLLSNHNLIKNYSMPYGFWSCAFSPDDRFLYVSAMGNPTSYLMQIDLQDSAPWANADTIFSDSTYAYSFGALKLAPDNKIYFSCAWYDGINFNYPYPDTVYNNVINNLSVINTPDSLGTGCNFTPYSFYLGGARTYVGLPNNPDYDLPRLQGSLCDTIQWAAVLTIEPPKGEMYVSYINDWQKAFINVQHLKGTTYTLSVIDITGRQIFKEKGRLRPPYFTKDLDCNGFSKGMYIVTLTTNKEQVTQKFIKN